MSSTTCLEWRDLTDEDRRVAALRYVEEPEALRFALAIDDLCRRLGALAGYPDAPDSVEEVALQVLATGRFRPIAGAIATPEPSASRAPGQPTVGGIVFGTSLDEAANAVRGETRRFKATYRTVAWVAILADRIDGSAKVEVVVARKEPGGSERAVLREVVDSNDPLADSFADEINLTSLLDNEPGTYVMRYLVDGVTAAAGEIVLVE